MNGRRGTRHLLTGAPICFPVIPSNRFAPVFPSAWGTQRVLALHEHLWRGL